MTLIINMAPIKLLLLLLFLCSLPAVAVATTVVVPTDEDLIIESRSIVRAEVISVESGFDEQQGDIFTYVTLKLQDVLKGQISAGKIVLKEPGGELGEQGSIIFGTPRFLPGEEVIVYLDTWPDGSLRVHQMFLGKFSISFDRETGQSIVARSVPDGSVLVLSSPPGDDVTHQMELSAYVEMVRRELAAIAERAQEFEALYYANVPILAQPPEYDLKSATDEIRPQFVLMSPAARWFEPDSAQSVVFRINMAGAPNPQISSDIAAVMNSWSTVAGCSIRFSNGSTTTACQPSPGTNTIVFNNCDSSFPPSSSCSGVIARGGFHYTTAQSRVVNGRSFYKITDGHLSFNPYSSCHFSNHCDIQEVATHELGHALGLDHSADTSATMYAYAHFDGRCASLRPDDRSGVAFIYPASTGCTYSIAPVSQSFGSSGGTGSVALTSSSGCTWTAVSNSPWVSITSATSGSGSATVTFRVSANSTTGSRTGTMTIAGHTFTVTQSGVASCSYSISQTSQSFGASVGSGSVSVTTLSGCGWTALSNASWISITSPSSSSGSGTVTYTVSANASSSRTGTMTIAGYIFTVTQSGISCSYSIAPASQAVGAAGGNGTVSVSATSGCSWTAVSSVGWMSIAPDSSGGVGNGTVSFFVSANASGGSRTGTMTIAGQTFSVTQSGANCGYSISPVSQSVSPSGGSGSVAVTTSSACSWTAASNINWISITSGSSGSGSGTVTYLVAANSNTSSRTGTVTIAGQNFTVTQAASGQSQSIDLTLDDGSFEDALGLRDGGTSYMVNRFTPGSYPAMLSHVLIYFRGGDGVRAGDTLSVLVGTTAGGTRVDGTTFQMTPATVMSLGQFNVYDVPDVTIDSGDFVLGLRMYNAAGVYPYATDKTLPLQRRSYASTDGSHFTLIDDVDADIAGNFGIRARLQQQPEGSGQPTITRLSADLRGDLLTLTGTATDLEGDMAQAQVSVLDISGREVSAPQTFAYDFGVAITSNFEIVIRGLNNYPAGLTARLVVIDRTGKRSAPGTADFSREDPGGPLISRVTFDDDAGVLTIKGNGFTGALQLEVNGVIVAPPTRIKAKGSGAKLKIGGGVSNLNLRPGYNRVRVISNSRRSNVIVLLM